MRATVSAVLVLGLAFALPARAALLEDAFKDVPANHWAASAVVEMAVKRSLLRGYPDDTFRGDNPLSRLQLAQSLKALLEELEARSKTSWVEGDAGQWPLSDLATSSADHALASELVNSYHLWHDVPIVDAEHFRPDETVTRSEVAQVVRNLLSLGEAKKVVLPRDPRDPTNPFKDLTPAEWAYHAILADDQRYRVMVGFPDVTFRADDQLTRYQYAAVAAQTFGVIRDLVAKTMHEREELAPTHRWDRFGERRPWAFSLSPGGSWAGATGGLSAGGAVSYAGYPGTWFWLGSCDGAIGSLSGQGYSSALVTGGAFPQVPSLPVPQLGALQLQPYLGARIIADSSAGPAAGVPVAGGVGYWHQGKWGAFVLGDLNLFEAGPKATGLLPLGRLDLGGEYSWGNQTALLAGLGLERFPSAVSVGPVLGLDTAF